MIESKTLNKEDLEHLNWLLDNAIKQIDLKEYEEAKEAIVLIKVHLSFESKLIADH